MTYNLLSIIIACFSICFDFNGGPIEESLYFGSATRESKLSFEDFAENSFISNIAKNDELNTPAVRIINPSNVTKGVDFDLELFLAGDTPPSRKISGFAKVDNFRVRDGAFACNSGFRDVRNLKPVGWCLPSVLYEERHGRYKFVDIVKLDVRGVEIGSELTPGIFFGLVERFFGVVGSSLSFEYGYAEEYQAKEACNISHHSCVGHFPLGVKVETLEGVIKILSLCFGVFGFFFGIYARFWRGISEGSFLSGFSALFVALIVFGMM